MVVRPESTEELEKEKKNVKKKKKLKKIKKFAKEENIIKISEEEDHGDIKEKLER